MSDTTTDELVATREALAAARAELVALRRAYGTLLDSVDGSAVQVSTDDLRDVDLEALAASYVDILDRPGIPRAYRTWYTDLLRGLRSVQAWRQEHLQGLAEELNLPPSWEAVAALEADEA